MKLMPVIVVSLAFIGFLYGVINPSRIKSESEIQYERLGFPKQPLWFYRALALIGCLGSGLVLLKLTLWKSN